MSGGVPGVDTAALRSWLVELGLPVEGELRFSRLGQGQSNLTYRVLDEAGHVWVLRRPPLGHLLASAHDVDREARILSALGPTDVPVPEIFGRTSDAAVADAPVVLMEMLTGRVIESPDDAEDMSEEQRRTLGLNMVDTLIAIGSVDLDVIGLTDLASHKPYAARQLKRWSGQWEQSKTRDIPAMDKLTDRLKAAVPERTSIALVHGDFHIGNVLSDPKTSAVLGVLDWELSTLGDPLADMGSMLAYWAEPADTGALFPASALQGFPSRADLTERYLSQTGADENELRFWHALGLWKIAVIVEGVIRRVLDVPENSSEKVVATPEVVDALIAAATAVADEARI